MPGMRPLRPMRRLLSRPALALALAPPFAACASTGGDPRRDPRVPPPPIPREALCLGTPEHPSGERDPACAPASTHEPVEVVSHLAGCRVGARGPVEVLLASADGERTLGVVRPGETLKLALPRGDVTLVLVDGARRDDRALHLEGAGPVRLELGCAANAFPPGGLQPLVLDARRSAGVSSCPAGPIKVRAGGLDLEVGPDQVQTLFLPRGSHVLRVAGVERTVDLGDGGLEIPIGGCATSGP